MYYVNGRALITLFSKLNNIWPDDEPPALPDQDRYAELRHAAVLVLLAGDPASPEILYVRRSDHLKQHAGEIGFPGGSIEDGEDAPQAALREAQEEVALDPASVRILGSCSPVVTFSSGFSIQPVVGVCESRPDLSRDGIEIERIIWIPLQNLLAPNVWHRDAVYHVCGQRIQGWEYPVAGERMWGATARITRQLLHRLHPQMLPGP